MAWLKLSDICEMVGGTMYGDDAAVERIGIDSRTMQEADLFVALPGQRFDGHRFAGPALAAGAAGVLTAHKLDLEGTQIVVRDTLQALLDLARAWRKRLQVQMIALTGSNGKTTTKEMLASIFRLTRKTLVTQGNYNNHIGVPLTLLRLRREDEVGVIEIGANHLGEVGQLTQLAEPDVGLVINATNAHLEGFGSLEAIARAKGELFENLPDQATAIINADSPHYSYWQGLSGQRRKVSFGMEHTAEVGGEYDAGRGTITIAGETREVKLQVPGKHNFCNALAASATAYAGGADFDAIIAGLEKFTAIAGRLAFAEGCKGARLIDDSYNANPASLRAAVEVLCECSGERWLVLGDMYELGSEALALHADAGRFAKAAGVTRMLTVGELAQAAAEGFGSGARHFETVEALIERLLAEVGPNITVLIKGSRAARLERVVSALTNRETSVC